MNLRASVLFSAGLAAAPALAMDYSDHWWNPAESGRGIMIEQRGARAYAIVYDFRDNGLPVWYIAPGLSVRSAAADAPPVLSGALFRAFDNGPGTTPRIEADQVGEITIEGESVSTARAVYTVSGRRSEQPLQRLDFADTRPEGRYLATVATADTAASVQPAADVASVLFTAATTPQGEFVLSSESAGAAGVVRCSYSGDGGPLYVQTGRTAAIRARSLCNGAAGTLLLREIEFTSAGFTARIDETGARNIAGGRLAALRLGPVPAQ
ncbi:hypothetical protein [Tahibacter harae]|uniref:Uncharacterized protein n=1 Tax=Tahibacter harae TaxID=2963937 RepID=A0ABT1QWV9_9GAMM|nr:hypothetical protein [Tahibacter harae]MCQ4166774.1 hypothetical protein [Tahibacter harae]